jgi:hypothetical protein
MSGRTDPTGKRLDDEDSAGWWKALPMWLTLPKPSWFWGQDKERQEARRS